MSTLLDTNILTRSAKPADPQHRAAVDATDVLGKSGERLCLVPQNFYEFWAVATRPLAQNGLGMSVPEAEAELAKFRRLFTILEDVPVIRSEWEQLVTRLGVVGKNAHDARLVAAMNVHGLTQLLTFNNQDFQRYPGISVVTPDDVLKANP
jgi:predicted nucleic acid-binding protein